MKQEEFNRIMFFWVIGISIFVIILLFVVLTHGHKEEEWHEEFFQTTTIPEEFPPDTEIYCEEGVTISKFTFAVVIYPCLELKEGRCIGADKLCFVRYLK